MVNQKFQELYGQLNPAQKKAVNTIEGAVMVVAGPGTGKTQILTLRIANILLKTDVSPENILALTFTESAASNMRSRLVEIIGTPGFRVVISTFHSFCNDIIKNYPEDFPHLIASDSITELEQVQIIEKIVQAQNLTILKPFGDPMYYVRSIRNAIDELKKEGVTAEAFKEALVKQKEDFDKTEGLYHDKGAYKRSLRPNGLKGEMKGKYQILQREIAKNEELGGIYEKYQKMLFEKKGYDFNDMLLEVLVVLEKNRGLLISLQEKYQYILVDEHQDTNNAQNKIIELLCSYYPNPNLFVVGDEKQAIFRFQGASLENFIFFKNLYLEAVLINLTNNYRSNQTILDAAGSLISQNSMANVLFPEAGQLKAQAGLKEELVKVATLSDFFAEYHYIANDIQTKLKQGENLGEIAVIGRNNRDLQPMVDVLESRGVAFSLEADQNIFQDAQIRKLIMLLRAVANFGDDAALIGALHIDCIGAQPLDVYKIMRYCHKNRTSVIEVISSSKILKTLALDDLNNFERFYEKLQNWTNLSHNDNFESLFVKVLNGSGLMEWILKAANSLEVLDKLTGVFEDIKVHVAKNPDFGLSDFLDYLDLLSKHDLLLKSSVKTRVANAVKLMTAHKSKGLEFDVVYIINCFDGHWGNQKKRSRAFKIPWEYMGVKLKLGVELDENEDERRLFYVSMTRARREVVISYSSRSLESREQVQSQFIGEIADNYKEIVEVVEFEDNFLKQKQVIFAPKMATPPQIKNKQFLNEIFIDRGLSVTALNNYLECPWTYFYRNLLLIPDVKTKSLIFGTAVHAALNAYLKSVKGGDSGRAELARMTTKDGVGLLMKAFEEAMKKENPSERDFKDLMKKGEKMIPGYYENVVSKWDDQRLSELYIRGVKIDERVFLNGKIDMIEPLDGVAVRVTDFKTGKPKSRGFIEGSSFAKATGDEVTDDKAGGDGGYLRQLVFYKILLDNYQFKKMQVVEGVIDFVEPDSKGKYHREVFKIGALEVKQLEELVRNVGKEILDLAFWDRRCGKKNCQYCALADMSTALSSEMTTGNLRTN